MRSIPTPAELMERRREHAHSVQDCLFEARDQLFELLAESDVELDRPVLTEVLVSRVQAIAFHLSKAIDSIEPVCSALDRAVAPDDPQAMDVSRWPAQGQQTEAE